MNNADVQQTLDDCAVELARVKILIDGLGVTSAVVPYMTMYALIRACGTIEQAFKSIIADFCARRSKKQLKRFLVRKVRDSSMNPSYKNICRLLNDFDDNWKSIFKSDVNAHRDKTILLSSLESLVAARNEFAHGGRPTTSIGDVLLYFAHARKLIELLDNVIS